MVIVGPDFDPKGRLNPLPRSSGNVSARRNIMERALFQSGRDGQCLKGEGLSNEHSIQSAGLMR